MEEITNLNPEVVGLGLWHVAVFRVLVGLRVIRVAAFKSFGSSRLSGIGFLEESTASGFGAVGFGC